MSQNIAELFQSARAAIRNSYSLDWRKPIQNGFLKIKTEDSQLVPLVPNEVQAELLDLIWKDWCDGVPVRIIIPKPRREGISTICEAIIYSITAFCENYNGYLLGYNDENAREIFEMTQLMHSEMEISIRTKTKASNAKEIVFSENHSKVAIGSAQIKEIRGKGIHAFHGSEVAFYPNPKETMGGLLQSIPDNPRTIILLESTGNGLNWFEQRCREAEAGIGEYKLFFIPWFRNQRHRRKIPINYELIPMETGRYGDEKKLVTEYGLDLEQLYWRRFTIDDKCSGDLSFFAQEYPATLDECFQSSGLPVFPLEQLAIMQRDSQLPALQGVIDSKKILINPNSRGWLQVWHKPDPQPWRHRYVIGADTGGTWEGADYSVAYVYDRLKRQICATIHGHFDAYEYREYLVILSVWYQRAVLAVEINRENQETDEMGNTVLDSIMRDYPKTNLYTRRVVDDQSKEVSTKIGWWTSHETKQMIVDRLRRFVLEYEQEKIEFNDRNLIEEMKTYIISRTKTGKAKWDAQEGKKDDRVMAFGITLCVAETEPRPRLKNVKKDRRGGIKND